jgi:hypothetical protein
MHPYTDISLNNRLGYIASSVPWLYRKQRSLVISQAALSVVFENMAGSVRSYSEPNSSEHTGVHMWPAHTQATHWKNEIRE